MLLQIRTIQFEINKKKIIIIICSAVKIQYVCIVYNNMFT